jgi:hypothetical protein
MTRLFTVGLLAVTATGVAAQQPSPRDAVLAADQRLMESVRSQGLAVALPASMSNGAVLNWPGLALVVGPDQARRALQAQPGIARMRFTWQPLRVEVATDGSLALMWGTIARERPSDGSGGPELRLGKYLAAWVREGDAWRLQALAFANLFPSSEGHWTDALGPRELPAIRSRGAVGPFVAADSIFASDAGHEGAAVAFGRWAAGDATTFAGNGELRVGSRAIKASLDGDTSKWEWAPVAAGASNDGVLGWTAGQATISDKSGAFKSKYLTFWMRQANGQIRFFADGGSGRP